MKVIGSLWYTLINQVLLEQVTRAEILSTVAGESIDQVFTNLEMKIEKELAQASYDARSVVY